ncbi:MAG: glycolate oxidase iron-sulfur subunit [Pseudomonadota bacterium]|nr:glycolate oxidase iron-sulfur subunit [Pseudomonadota bacterium]
MCGMCLPHCPTYQIYRNESESPRGRISVIQAYAQDRLQPDGKMQQHLDHCLGCMACEAMCPSNVAYGRLLDNAQVMLADDKTNPRKLLRMILNQASHDNGFNRYAKPLRWYRKSGLQSLAGAVLRLAGNTPMVRANDILGIAQTTMLKNFYPASKKNVLGEVALFAGCMGSGFDGETLSSSIQVLTHLGYNLHIPSTQYCCGALHQHHGQPQQAQLLAQQNQSAFGNLPVSHIIHTSNGCGARLAQSNMPVPVIDILSFLLSSPALASTEFWPLDEKALLHESCSSLHKLRLAGVIQQALKMIPQLQIIDIPGPRICCGAGSSHQLLFPELADKLLQLKTDIIKAAQPKYLLSDNLGCSLHFRSGLKKAGIEVKVIHPVTLLAQQLG